MSGPLEHANGDPLIDDVVFGQKNAERWSARRRRRRRRDERRWMRGVRARRGWPRSSADCLTGLMRYVATPSSRQRAASPAPPDDVSITIVGARQVVVFRSIALATVKPSMLGHHHIEQHQRGTGGHGRAPHERRPARPRRSRPAWDASAISRGSSRESGGWSRCRRRRAPTGPRAPAGTTSAGACVSWTRTRTVKWNVVPCPGVLSTQMRPPIICDERRTEMVRPSPVPPYVRVMEPSAWLKASKIIACLSSRDADARVAHGDVQRWRRARPARPAVRAQTLTTTSPSLVNLMALPTRLTST